MNRIRIRMPRWLIALWLSVQLSMVALRPAPQHRLPAQGFIEFALLIVVLVAIASLGLGVLGTDLSGLFTDLGSKLKLPAGFGG
ncbi:MAG: hypothetical protein ACR2IK_25160 [Chloroflexota bacterium]